MNIFSLRKKSNSKNTFFYNPEKEDVKTDSIFDITIEGNDLRVKNQNINCLFRNLNYKKFNKIYNKFFKCLNLDFSEIIIENKKYELTERKQEYLIQTIITSRIYFYAVNELKIEIKESDFSHPFIIDYILEVIDKKYGKDTNESLQIGARILRMQIDEYSSAVKGRRRYYEK